MLLHYSVVYPEDGADSTSVNAITTRLQTYVDNPGDIYTSTADELGILFWRLDITESQSNEIREFAGVRFIPVTVLSSGLTLETGCISQFEPPMLYE